MNSIIRKGLMLASFAAAAPAFSASIDAITGHWKLISMQCDGKDGKTTELVGEVLKSMDMHITTNTLAIEGKISFFGPKDSQVATVALIRGADRSHMWIQVMGSLNRDNRGILVEDKDEKPGKPTAVEYSLSADGRSLKMDGSADKEDFECKAQTLNFVRQ